MEVPSGAAGVGEHPVLPAPTGTLLPAQPHGLRGGLGKEGSLHGELSPLQRSVPPPSKGSSPADMHSLCQENGQSPFWARFKICRYSKHSK